MYPILEAKLMKNKKTGETKLVHDVIGPVETTYKFNGLCDFQYLPMVQGESPGQFESVKEQVMLNHLPTTKELATDTENTPLFLPPMSFSRYIILATNLSLFTECYLNRGSGT